MKHSTQWISLFGVGAVVLAGVAGCGNGNDDNTTAPDTAPAPINNKVVGNETNAVSNIATATGNQVKGAGNALTGVAKKVGNAATNATKATGNAMTGAGAATSNAAHNAMKPAAKPTMKK